MRRLPSMTGRAPAVALRHCFALFILLAWASASFSAAAAHPARHAHPVQAPQPSRHTPAPRGLPAAPCETWLISTRNICGWGCCDLEPSDFDVRRLDCESGWVDSSVAKFLAQDDPNLLTVFYVHGNRCTWDDALESGWEVEQALIACGNPRLRFVIWSWPSDPIFGPLKDVRAKAVRADLEGVYLAWFLAQMNPDTPVGFLGFSYGARIVTGSLHVLSGGHLCSGKLPTPASPRRPMRAVLMAAALDNDWLLPGHYHGLAMMRLEKLLLFNNSRDPALMRYWLVRLWERLQALGCTGLAGGPEWMGQTWRRIEQWDVCDVVRASHNEQK